MDQPTAPAPAPVPVNLIDVDQAAIMGALYGDGIVACQGAFSADWVARLGEDIAVLFAEAQRQPGGALERGPNRFYVEIHPERVRGFAELVSHPWVVAVCSAVLGPQYRVVEAGFDIPGPGAMKQPWHRDFPSPAATMIGRRLNSLAFNLTTVDVTPDMGPFEIAPGTQWDVWEGDPMFPPPTLHPCYEARRQRKLPRMGDISARSALTVHRGTANVSTHACPAFVLGVDAPDANNAAKHDLQLTRAYHDALPDAVRRHVSCRVVERLEPVLQAHTIAGLLKGHTG